MLSKVIQKKAIIGIAAAVAGIAAAVVVQEDASANAVNDYIVSKVNNDGWQGASQQLSSNFGQIPVHFGYEHGWGHPEGVIVHETANPNSTIYGEINYMTRNYAAANVHNFVDGSTSLALMDTDGGSWGAGPTANSKYIQTEQVRVHSKDEFAHELLNLAREQAEDLHKYNLTPSLGNTVVSHAMTSRMFGETDHTDPNQYWYDSAHQWFGNSNYTMDDYIWLVTQYYNGTLKKAPIKTATLTQKYVDANTGKEIRGQETYTRNVGDTINATARDVSGYFTPGAQSVKIGDNGATVTFKYNKLFQMTDVKSMDKFGTIDSSKRVDDMYNNAPYGVQGYSYVSGTNSYNGWNGLIKKSAKANGVTFYLINLNGMEVWVDARAFGTVEDTPQQISESTKTQYANVSGSAQDIRIGGDPRWNKQTELADGNAIINSNSAKSATVKITDVRTYQYDKNSTEYGLDANHQKTWIRMSQNGKDLGWTPSYNVDKALDNGSSAATPTTPDKNTNNNSNSTPDKDAKVTITIKAVDETGYQIAKDRTIDVTTGTGTDVKPDDLSDYNTPAIQHVDGSKNATVTFKYSYKYPNIAKAGLNVSTLNTSQKEFVNRVLPTIQSVSNGNDLYQSVMLAQAVSESAYGSSELATKANALFGIKAGSDWKGKTYTKDTQEVVNGKTVTVKGTFRAYDSIDDSLKDYAAKLKSGSAYGDKNFYSNVFKTNAPSYVDAIMNGLQGKYSTNTNYGMNLINTINALSLYKLDGYQSPASINGALTINYQDANGKTISATKMQSVLIGQSGTVDPIAIDGYIKPASQSYQMTSKGIVVTFKYDSAVKSENDTTIANGTWQTNGNHDSQIYSDVLMTNAINGQHIAANANVTVNGSFTIKGGKNDGKHVLQVSQNGKSVGYVFADDFHKTAPAVTAKQDSELTNGQWQTTTTFVSIFNDNLLKNKTNTAIRGNVKVLSQFTLTDTNKTKVLQVSQNGKTLGYVDASQFTKTLAIAKKTVANSWPTIMQDTTVYKDNLGQQSSGNTRTLSSKTVTVKEYVTLNNGTVMIHITQQGKTPVDGWIDAKATNKAYN